jgi:hypothetical protein
MKTRVIQDEPAPPEPASSGEAPAESDAPDDDVATDPTTNGDKP